ncbi:MAG TPA: hypothetical protein VF363_06875 [Candidatus Eisenbacteria bacterium]
MAPFLIGFSAFSSISSIALILYYLIAHADHLAFRIVSCMLLLDQGIVTLLYLRLPVTVPPLGIGIRIGAGGVLAVGLVLLVWNAAGRPEGPDPTTIALAALMIALGALTIRPLPRVGPPDSR